MLTLPEDEGELKNHLMERARRNGDLRAYSVSDWVNIMLRAALAYVVFLILMSVVAGVLFFLLTLLTSVIGAGLLGGS